MFLLRMAAIAAVYWAVGYFLLRGFFQEWVGQDLWRLNLSWIALSLPLAYVGSKLPLRQLARVDSQPAAKSRVARLAVTMNVEGCIFALLVVGAVGWGALNFEPRPAAHLVALAISFGSAAIPHHWRVTDQQEAAEAPTAEQDPSTNR